MITEDAYLNKYILANNKINLCWTLFWSIIVWLMFTY